VAVKRSIVLINPTFQLKFSLFVSVVVLISSIIYPYTIYQFVEIVLQEVAKLQAASGSAAITKTVLAPETIEAIRSKALIALIVYQFAFIGIIFIVCIFQSHKIAGPVYKLRKSLKSIRDGAPLDKIYFRKGDNFIELADDYNQTLDYLQENRNKDFAYLSEVSSFINNLSLVIPEDKKSVLNEITKKLSEIQSRYKS